MSISLVCMVRPGADLKERRRGTRARLEVEVERGRSRVSKDISRPNIHIVEVTPGSSSSSQQ